MTPNIVCHFQSYRLLWYEYVPSTPGLKNKLFHHPCPLYQTQYRGLEISHKCRLRLKCDGKGAETRFRLSAKRTSPFKSAGASVQSTTGSRGVRISGSNAGYTMFRGSVKGTGYPLHSPVSPSLSLPCVTVCHHISTRLYHAYKRLLQTPILIQTNPAHNHTP